MDINWHADPLPFLPQLPLPTPWRHSLQSENPVVHLKAEIAVEQDWAPETPPPQCNPEYWDWSRQRPDPYLSGR
jgi:hypothetical protein